MGRQRASYCLYFRFDVNNCAEDNEVSPAKRVCGLYKGLRRVPYILVTLSVRSLFSFTTNYFLVSGAGTPLLESPSLKELLLEYITPHSLDDFCLLYALFTERNIRLAQT